MSLQRYRADRATPQSDGAIRWYSEWNYGPSLARIDNCRLENLVGNMRRTVYITGEADTWFSQPACCMVQGKRVNGYVTCETDTGDCLVFRHTYEEGANDATSL
jgi:hypothetical protein